MSNIEAFDDAEFYGLHEVESLCHDSPEDVIREFHDYADTFPLGAVKVIGYSRVPVKDTFAEGMATALAEHFAEAWDETYATAADDAYYAHEKALKDALLPIVKEFAMMQKPFDCYPVGERVYTAEEVAAIVGDLS